MRIAALEAFGIDNEIIDLWHRSGHDTLLPVQESAVRDHKVLDGNSLLVFSPTSSGKTFVGEMAAIRTARQNRRVLYLVPQKALAEEKYREFRSRYGRFGVRVAISTRDRREFDAAINRGQFHIAVVVFEKMQGLLVTNPTLLRNVGLVVIDELQMIGDTTRGAGLEVLLTKMRISEGNPQLIGLSAVLGDCKGLADWLGAELCVTEERPVELRKGVLCDGVFRYTEHNSGQTGQELLDHAPQNGTWTEAVVSQVRRFVDAGEQCLVFCKSKRECVETAAAVAEKLDAEPAVDALQELQDLEDSRGKDQLMQLLQRRVAYHNANLDWDQRDLIERHFREGEIAVICATSTLAMGINLPARNVFIDPERWDRDRYGRWGTEPISVADYENMSGRAGRLGLEDEFGRAIIISDSEFQTRTYEDVFVNGDLGDVEPALGDAPLSHHVVNLVASRLCQKREEVAEVLLSSYTGELFWRGGEREGVFRNRLEAAIDRCLAGGLVEQQRENLTATKLGRLTAVKGISVDTAIRMAEFARENREYADGLDVLEILMCLSGTEDGERIYFNLSGREHRSGEYQAIFADALDSLPAEAIGRLQTAEDLEFYGYDETKRAKKTLILRDWIGDVRTRDIEVKFHCFSGSIRGMVAEFAWLAEAFSGIAGICGWPDEKVETLHDLSQRLLHGVSDRGIELANARVRGLARERIKALVSAGLHTLRQIVEAPYEQIEKLITKPVAARLVEQARRLLQREEAGEAADGDAVEPDEGEALEAEWPEHYPPSDALGVAYRCDLRVHIDGRTDSKRHLVTLNEEEAWLTDNSFLAILQLAVAARTSELGWLSAWELGDPDKYYQIIRRLRRQLSVGDVDPTALIENSGQQRYRLSVPPSNITFDDDMIRRHHLPNCRIENMLLALNGEAPDRE
jgi:helicase